MKLFLGLLLTALIFDQCRNKNDYVGLSDSASAETPAILKKQHSAILEKLERIAAFGDSTGRVARQLLELMEYHFKEEEDYVLPPLGFLPSLALGKIPAHRENIIQLTEKFKSNSAKMIAEHQLITAYLREMVLIAAKENHPGAEEFEKEVRDHAAFEEQVLFPSSVLIGDYLRLVP